MARDSQAALVALHRFVLGARGGAADDFVDAASDPRGFVKAELNRPSGARLELPGLSSTPALAETAFAYQREVKQAREGEAKSRRQSPADLAPEMSANGSGGAGSASASDANAMAPNEAMQTKPERQPEQPLNIIQKTFRAEALARLQRAMVAESGFLERLVAFWSNHFCISANKGALARIWAGAFEREAIRPHVLGRFGDMLQAVEQHPAMLFFLDNQQSIGPDSRAGRKRKRGLNENLAREIW